MTVRNTFWYENDAVVLKNVSGFTHPISSSLPLSSQNNIENIRVFQYTEGSNVFTDGSIRGRHKVSTGVAICCKVQKNIR